MKTRPRAALKKKCIILAKQLCRRLAQDTCAMCGRAGLRDDGRPWKMEAHHLIPVGRNSYHAADLDNLICLCFRCHKYESSAPHYSPELFERWLQAHLPDRFAWLQAHRYETGKVDWAETWEDLRDIEAAMDAETEPSVPWRRALREMESEPQPPYQENEPCN